MGKLKTISDNRKARFAYTILSKVNAGIVLQGTEVKALREGRVRLDESYARIIDREVFVYDMYIGEYSHAGRLMNHETSRPRKLLLNKHEIIKLRNKLREKGLTLVPLTLFFNERNVVKMTLALAQGKMRADKRETMKKRDAERSIRRAMRR